MNKRNAKRIEDKWRQIRRERWARDHRLSIAITCFVLAGLVAWSWMS
jgi:hypothetical protein